MKVVRAGLFLLVLAALATVPMVATDFQLFRYTNIVIYALALIGMNLLVGYNGQVSLGHGFEAALRHIKGSARLISDSRARSTE